MEVDMRSENAERLNTLDNLLKQAVQKGLQEENTMKRQGPDLTVEMKMVGDRPSGVQDTTLALINRAAAASQYLGLNPD
jgi:tripeptide aminopeptidase